MPCGIICGRIIPARGNLEHRPLSGAMYGVNILVSQYAILLTFESREEVGIHTIRLLKFFLKLSDFIPHKSHYVILHSSTDTDIKSDPLLNPTIILNFRLAIPPDNNLNLHDTFRTPTN